MVEAARKESLGQRKRGQQQAERIKREQQQEYSRRGSSGRDLEETGARMLSLRQIERADNRRRRC